MIGDLKILNISEVQRGITNKKTIESFPGQPMSECPRCRLLLPDFDGFGVVSHVHQPDDRWPEPCGYCTHPAMDGNVCCICGAQEDTIEFVSSKIP